MNFLIKLCFMMGTAGGHFDTCQMPQCLKTEQALWMKNGPGFPPETEFRVPTPPPNAPAGVSINYPPGVKTGRMSQVKWIKVEGDALGRYCLAQAE